VDHFLIVTVVEGASNLIAKIVKKLGLRKTLKEEGMKQE
jgi:hypothetical protein